MIALIVCVVGPTGVGKTKLSIALAKKYKAVIINADACQIYKELNIGTAKIKEEEKEGIEHLLFDIKEVNDTYSAADYQEDLRSLIAKYQNQNIIIVGGTGLYLKAGLYDYNFSKIKKQDYSRYTNEELYKMCLKRLKGEKNTLDVHNRRRLENFLNREELVKKEPKSLYNVHFIGLTTTRDILYQRINQRVEEMFEEGLEKEVRSLYEKYPDALILQRAIGYKEVILYLKGEITKEECIELIQKNSRHYAKRQYTWFNNQMDVKWFMTDFNDFQKTINEVSDYLEQFLVK